MVENKKRDVFDTLIERRMGTSINPPQTTEDRDPTTEELTNQNDLDDKMDELVESPDHEDILDSMGRILEQQLAFDKIINAEVMIQNGDETAMGKVARRSLDADGRMTGTYHDNPFLNTITYNVECPDGQVKEYGANIIAENLLTQVDLDGYSLSLMDSIIDLQRDPSKAIPIEDKYITTKSRQKQLWKTMKGWKLLIKWKDKSKAWINLADMKEAHPVETAEYARARGISNEPAFAWWVPYTLRQREVILAAVKNRIRKTTHKYGIEIPRDVEHAHEIDARNGNTMWRDALKKEMYNVGVAFEILDEGAHVPHGWKQVTGHLVWDVKMDFTRKARWVLDGHKTPDPIGSTYAGVVSRESVRRALIYAALNDLNVFAANIQNAYLQALSSQKDYIICGPEFGVENIGRMAFIHRALYGGKAAGRDFRNHLRSCMEFLNFKSCLADPNVWMRPAIKSDGNTYYEYILLYVDDALVVSENAESIPRNELRRYFHLKEESIGPPTIYLGGRVCKVQLENSVRAWSLSSSQYVQSAVKNVEEYIRRPEISHLKIPSKAETPLMTSYRSELDVSPELTPRDSAYYQSLIGILRWIVELGRIDICLEVSMMSSHLAMPRKGHLGQVLHIFTYLCKYHNTELVYGPSDPIVEHDVFEQRDWTSSEFGAVQGKEEIPSNMPEPRGLGFIM